MTLAQICELALRQLDEDLSDIAEFEPLFRYYANEGYSTAQRRWYHPKETMTLETDAAGCATLDERAVHLLELHHASGYKVPYALSAGGWSIVTHQKHAALEALCEVRYPALEKATDEPKIPDAAHGALVDYICYRHLLNGNTAKQSRAQMYLMQYERAMREMGEMGARWVTHMRGLYEASDVRNARW